MSEDHQPRPPQDREHPAPLPEGADTSRASDGGAGGSSDGQGSGCPAEAAEAPQAEPGRPRALRPEAFSPAARELLQRHGIEVRVLAPAPRGTRLLAFVVDSVLTSLAAGVVLLTLRPGLVELLLAREPVALEPAELVGLTGLEFLVYMALHGPFLARTGQSIGKRLLRLRIADARDGTVPDLMRILLRRVLPFTVLQAIPLVGPGVFLADSIGALGRDRRCVHDLVAGTLVVKA